MFPPHRLVRPRTPGFHPGNTGSNPVGVAISFLIRGIGVCLPKLDLLTRLLYPPPDAACTACEAEIPATHYRLMTSAIPVDFTGPHDL